MFDPVAESMPVEERRAQQTQRLRAQVTRLRDSNDFYHRQLADVGDDVSIEDLGSIPTISKQDLWDQYPLKAVGSPALGVTADPRNERHERSANDRCLHRERPGHLPPCQRCASWPAPGQGRAR